MTFRPTASWDLLRRRAELLRQVRHFFDERGFVEVETPLLSHDTVVDRYLEPLSVDVNGQRCWLQTSPEFAMKRLLASGGEAIYQVGKAFRGEEIGTLHNVEFTMVEWYRVGDDMQAGIDLLDELARAVVDRGPAERVSYQEAFRQHLGLDPHTTELPQLRDAAAAHDIATPGGYETASRDDWLDLLLIERVQPHLGTNAPVILYDYPAAQSALARVRDEEPPVAERFELYVDGVELANGYHELLDAAVLRQRIEQTNRQRATAGLAELPAESRLLTAMEAGLPPCAGVALGFDRLVMAATGAQNIREVLTFPFDLA